jgi:hypothetical protein
MLFVGVGGCTTVLTSQTIITPTLAVTETQLPAPVGTLTNTPKATSQPTRTYTLTSTPTLTHTPTPLPPTQTLTLADTLEPDQAAIEIKDLLENPVTCPFPCFWGIMPNITTLGEVRNIFHRLRVHFYPSSRVDNVFFADPRFDNLSINVQFEIQDELVKSVRGRIGLENYKGAATPRVWSSFSTENLLKQYGIPSSVDFNISYPTEPGFPQGIAWYSMIMRFDQYPFAIDYFKGEVRQDKLIQVCPLTDKFSGVDIYIGYDPATYRSKGVDGIPLEKITSIDIDRFYELMTQGKGSACFDLNADVYKNQ